MEDLDAPPTPSQIPKLAPSVVGPLEIPSPRKSPRKSLANMAFLSRESNIRAVPWDTEHRMVSMERFYGEFMEKMDVMTVESNGLKELVEVYKNKGEPKGVAFGEAFGEVLLIVEQFRT